MMSTATTTIGPGHRAYLEMRYADSPEAMAWLAAQPGPPAKPPRKPRPDEVGTAGPATRAEAEINPNTVRVDSDPVTTRAEAEGESGPTSLKAATRGGSIRLAFALACLDYVRKGLATRDVAMLVNRSPGTVRRGVKLAQAYLSERGTVLGRDDPTPLLVEAIPGAKPARRKARRKARPRGRPVGSRRGTGVRCFDLRARRVWLDAQQSGSAATSPQVAPAATA